MRVKLIDPSAFTPPYDRALAGALAARGADVELITSRFTYGPVPAADGYRVSLDFYRRATRDDDGSTTRRRLAKLAEHAPGMLALKRKIEREPAGPDPLVTHYQWLTLPRIDRHLIAGRRPRVITAHYVLSPRPGRGELRRARRLYSGMDAVIAHSRGGAGRLSDEAAVPAERIRVIPHGSFDHLTRPVSETGLPQELNAGEPAEKRGPVILFFGLLRPYKGLDVLIDACRRLDRVTPEGTTPELWVAGNPRMDLTDLKARAGDLPIPVRWATRFITDDEIAPLMRRADLLVLPYRDGEQSGVLYTGIAFGKAMIVSDVGGIGEVAREHNLARLVEPGDADALGAALVELTADPEARRALADRAAKAAREEFSWERIAAETLDLYRELAA